ncbi:MAG TPA: Crp/Fnr family transcriptional regulator [Opitutaceae bacterium]|nr:Crp/Fnr family transcriptional regulator [Opitutaceae bacterium]
MARQRTRAAGDSKHPAGIQLRRGNQILKLLPAAAFEAALSWLDLVELKAGETLYEPGDDITHAFLPLDGAVIGLNLLLKDGRALEAATIGREGAFGAIVSVPVPAFPRTMVQLAGRAARIPVGRLEAIKRSHPKVHDVFTRYTDCLLAQILQAVVCNAAHPLEARYARWLLLAQDRARSRDLFVTQEILAERFGVARTYLTRVAADLQRRGAISYQRGQIHIHNRAILHGVACECYETVRSHFDRILPGLYPSEEPQ